MAAMLSPAHCCGLLLFAVSCNQNGLAPQNVPASARPPLEGDVVSSVQVVKVDVPVRFNVAYEGAAKREFPDGLPLSIGSGLRLQSRSGARCLSEREARSGYSLLALSDRGPNADAPHFLDSTGVSQHSKSFLAVDFAPQLVTIDVNVQSGARVGKVVPLRSAGARAVGLPPAALTTELASSESLSILPPSAAGIDPEGLDFDAQGNLWLCEEYGPSLLLVEPETGDIVVRLVPGSGLPSVLANRQVNRGCEGVAVTPSGKVYGILQSTMDVDGKTKASAPFIRLFEYDPKTTRTRLFGYPHDVSAYKTSADAKLGDLLALDDTRFLTIEEGKDKNGKLRNIIYEFDLAGASDLSGVVQMGGPNSGKELEFATSTELTAQVRLAAKRRVLDLRAYGFTAEKAEGLALLDASTLVVINDNDFGAGGVIRGDATGGTDPTKYAVDAAGSLTFNGAHSLGAYVIHALPSTVQETSLFIVRLRREFSGYCASK